MKKILAEYLTRIDNLQKQVPEDLILELSDCISVSNVKSKTYLLNTGEICKHAFIVESGSAWKFYSGRGKKIATEFAFPGDIIFSFKSYTQQIPADEYIQVLEDSVIQKIEFGKFENLKFKSNILLEMDTLMLEYQILKLEDRLFALQFRSAEERLKWLLDREPHLFDKIPQKYLASYLGITLETFIRLKKSLI